MDMNLLIGIITLVLSISASVATSFLTLGKYKEKVDQLEKKHDKISDKVDALRSDTDKMISSVVSLEKSIDKLTDIAQAHSPITLTKKGEKLVEDSGFNKIFEEAKESLVKDLHKMQPHSQYDVQEKARILLRDMTTDKRFAPVETWAYNNGEDFPQILRAGSIKLRDYYFEKHPEIVDPKEVY